MPDGDLGPELDATVQRAAIRERYAAIAKDSGPCCSDEDSYGDSSPARSDDVGYSKVDRDAVGPGANLGLGCGNPTAIASLEEGNTVLDLGSGAGFDCFLAAHEVGPSGQVIGVDMTPEMVERARENVERNDAQNVEFRLGEIEHLPVADESVDVIISNCVVNLSPDKPQVFREAYRTLRPGGRITISDVVLAAELPSDLRDDPASVAECVGGASFVQALESAVADAGFIDISIEPKRGSKTVVQDWDEDRDLSEYIVSATIKAEKPSS